MANVQAIYNGYTDEQLVALVQGGDQKAAEPVFERHRDLVRGIARRFFLNGGDTDDLVQEGMMGLYQAITDYDANGKSSFKSFAYLCVYRRIVDAVKSAARKKNEPLLNGVSALADDLQTGEPSPEDIIILNDDKREFNQKISKILSNFEFKIIVMYMDGLTCAEICETLGKPAKSIDNAIQRSKRKLQEMLKK